MTTDQATIPAHIHALIEEYREPCGLDRWTVRPTVDNELADGAKAECAAMPEYREAKVYFALNRLETGDDIEELVAHEAAAHPLTWPIHAAAEHLADALANCLPEPFREPVRTQLQEYVREAAERSTTDVGQTILRYHRRLRDARTELSSLKRELRELRKPKTD